MCIPSIWIRHLVMCTCFYLCSYVSLLQVFIVTSFFLVLHVHISWAWDYNPWLHVSLINYPCPFPLSKSVFLLLEVAIWIWTACLASKKGISWIHKYTRESSQPDRTLYTSGYVQGHRSVKSRIFDRLLFYYFSLRNAVHSWTGFIVGSLLVFPLSKI